MAHAQTFVTSRLYEHEPRLSPTTSIPMNSLSNYNADVLVYTATASGVVASIAAARMGASVILIEPGQHVGGMLSGGLGHSDVLGQERLIGGITFEVYQRIAAYYGYEDGRDAFDFEPHVAETVLTSMLKEAGVTVQLGERLKRVEKKGGCIRNLVTEKGHHFFARMFIDAGYEGDLMAASGVSYALGREGRSVYQESLAGRMELLPGQHQFGYPVSSRLGKIGKKYLPRVMPQSELAATGEGDGKFQSYCFRLCLTDRSANRIEIEKPDDYCRDDYELLRRYFENGKGREKSVFGIARLPNGKSDINSVGPVSLNLLGAQWEYPEASYARRQEIWDEHLRWAHGFIWFLQNDASVPVDYREKIRRWGLCRDEFVDTGGWPHQLYIREGRRMLGDFVVTQQDLMETREKPDSVGMCGYNIDIREVQWVSVRNFHFPTAEDEVFMEGYVSQPVEPWQIPYRALVPKKAECENLLVSVCASMSTIAFGSFRMEPGYMIAGHAAGTAAALAARMNVKIQVLPVAELQSSLAEQQQILKHP